MAGGRADPHPGPLPRAARTAAPGGRPPHPSALAQRAAAVRTLPELAAVLRELRRRHARQRGGAGLTYRDLAAATAVFVELGEVRLEGYALGNLGATDSLLGRHTEALAHLDRALVNCRLAADPGGEGSALAAMGAVYRRLQRYPEALDHLHQALTISRETGDRSLETETLSTLGDTLNDMRQASEALDRFRAALALASQAGDRFEQARALDGIARVLATAGQRGQARAHWERALAIFSDLGVPEAGQVRDYLSKVRR